MTEKISPSVFDATGEFARSKMPWRIDALEEVASGGATASRPHWKLFHYLSGGGMKVFGRTIKQQEADFKRTRFLIGAGVFALIWLLLWI